MYVAEIAERFATKSSVKLGGFRSQLEVENTLSTKRVFWVLYKTSSDGETSVLRIVEVHSDWNW